MILTTTSRKIQAFIEGAHTTNAPTFVTTFADITTTTFTPDGTVGTLNGSTPVDMVAAPASSTQRVIKELQINNIDTVSHTVTVRELDSATPYITAQILVLPNSFLRYADPGGWQNGPVTGPGSVSSVAFTGDGTVFNSVVPGSPVTTTGTFAPSLHTQSANAAFIGPASGSAAAPTFRALVAADIPSLSATYLPLAGGTMTGALLGAVGAVGTPGFAFAGHTDFGMWYDGTNTALGLSVAGAEVFQISATQVKNTVVGAGASLQCISDGVTNNIVSAFSNTTGSARFILRGTKGTQASPAAVTTAFTLGTINYQGYGGSANVIGIALKSAVLTATPSDTDMESSWQIFGNAPGATGAGTEIGRFGVVAGFSMFGANPVIDANRLLLLRNFTVATLPAAPAVGATAFVTDAMATIITGLGLAPVGGGTNKVPVYYDGAWKIG